ncbi:MAG: hypothetical protein VR64_10260 [Desulfatitalea sp. BRH_c12]|nr:MAG: hypothetical protein VR64_10260 [Desulfatitalea sp. BRH_c12]
MKKSVFLWMGWVLISACVVFPAMAQATDKVDPPAADSGGVKSLEDRITHLEEVIDRPVESDKWHNRLKIGGLIEIEAGYGRVDFDDPAEDDEKISDVDLATVELVVDARIAAHIDGHVMLKYEEDDLFIDEGFITLTGTEEFPAYLIAGRQYIPFGSFESHFITDPMTLELGETNEGAVVIGYRTGGGWVDISLGAFNGKIEETGSDDHISNLVGRIAVTPFENFALGVSYTSNLAAADAFADHVISGEVRDDVGGWSVFATATVFERLTIHAEYLAAIDAFAAGEIYSSAETDRRKPAAWNLEMGYAFTDRWEMALRYGGSTDGDAGSGEFLPETQYGAVVNWGLHANTNLALEYLHSDFEDDYQSDAVVAQLAIAF